MPQASQAITLLLVGTGLCTFAYEKSARRYNQAATTRPISQSTGSSSGGYHSHSHYYGYSYSGGNWGSSGDSGSSGSVGHSSTVRGGFGGHGEGGHS